MEVAIEHPGSRCRHEEGRGVGMRTQPVTAFRIDTKRRPGGLMHGELAGLVELGVTHGEDPVDEVSVRAVKPERLADPHPGGPQQPEESLEGRLAKRRTE